jgi:mannose-6-phosphate isomerase-like protein (cupin superfamily)
MSEQRPTGGKALFAFDYAFAEGGRVEVAALPLPANNPAPFDVARWSIAPGTSNDLDVHISREVWLVASGRGTVTWADRSTTTIETGDAMAFETQVPHQVRNDGEIPLTVFSVYWKPRP